MTRKVSIIESDNKINTTRWVVSQIIAHNHASIVIEYLDRENLYAASFFDFLPTTPLRGIGAVDLKFHNDIQQGRIRHENLAHINNRDELIAMIRNLWKQDDIFITTWPVHAERANEVMEAIISEAQDPPNYQPSGNKRIGATGHNCITWVEEKLTAMGIALIYGGACGGYYGKVEDRVIVANPNSHLAPGHSSGSC
jgi:hypothetical protein